MMDTQLAVGLAVFVGFIFCIVVHECAHALVAMLLGDYTAYDRGRLTLNPIPHIDPIMSILLPGALWLSGSTILFGGAKPVPVIMTNFRMNRLPGMMLVALAGPVANVLLAVLFGWLLNFVPLIENLSPDLSRRIMMVWVGLVGTNVALALFNMIPIPPLDGSRILAACLGQSGWAIYQLEQTVGPLLVALIVFTGKTAILLGGPTLFCTAFIVEGTAFGEWSEQLASGILKIRRE